MIMRYTAALYGESTLSVLSSVEFRGLPLREDRKDEREGGVNALFVGMQMSARYR